MYSNMKNSPLGWWTLYRCLGEFVVCVDDLWLYFRKKIYYTHKGYDKIRNVLYCEIIKQKHKSTKDTRDIDCTPVLCEYRERGIGCTPVLCEYREGYRLHTSPVWVQREGFRLHTSPVWVQREGFRLHTSPVWAQRGV